MAFSRAAGRGVIVLTNGEAPVRDIAGEIYFAIDSLRDSSPDADWEGSGRIALLPNREFRQRGR